uniref:Uncharacterized protein n=2 Tax=Lygus hesperus TaxID=30085 RepID=A0A146L8X4_LYGHE
MKHWKKKPITNKRQQIKRWKNSSTAAHQPTPPASTIFFVSYKTYLTTDETWLREAPLYQGVSGPIKRAAAPNKICIHINAVSNVDGRLSGANERTSERTIGFVFKQRKPNGSVQPRRPARTRRSFATFVEV